MFGGGVIPEETEAQLGPVNGGGEAEIDTEKERQKKRENHKGRERQTWR